jgi:purine-nucleoside phosphorylase
MEAGIFERAEEAARYVEGRTGTRPEVGLILGSGMGGVAERMEEAVRVPYGEIPHFPRATVEGHRGQLVVGRMAGVGVAAMQGRVHGYEGYTPEETTFPVRVLGRMGVRRLVVTNAAGGIREGLRAGDLVALADHINFTGRNPLVGANEERFGARFFDMTEAYSRRLRRLAREEAGRMGFELGEGVYVGLSGPSYETPAEIRAFRMLGADLVGMSTVHEVIVARHMGMEVLGISCVTNVAAGVQEAPIDHGEVMETGNRVGERLGRLLEGVIARDDGGLKAG